MQPDSSLPLCRGEQYDTSLLTPTPAPAAPTTQTPSQTPVPVTAPVSVAPDVPPVVPPSAPLIIRFPQPQAPATMVRPQPVVSPRACCCSGPQCCLGTCCHVTPAHALVQCGKASGKLPPTSWPARPCSCHACCLDGVVWQPLSRAATSADRTMQVWLIRPPPVHQLRLLLLQIVADEHPSSCQEVQPCMPYSLAGAPVRAVPCMTGSNSDQHDALQAQPPPPRQAEAVQASTARQRAPTPDYQPEPAESFHHHHGDPDFMLSAATAKPVPSVSPRLCTIHKSKSVSQPGQAQDAACALRHAQPVTSSTLMMHGSGVPQTF